MGNTPLTMGNTCNDGQYSIDDGQHPALVIVLVTIAKSTISMVTKPVWLPSACLKIEYDNKKIKFDSQ